MPVVIDYNSNATTNIAGSTGTSSMKRVSHVNPTNVVGSSTGFNIVTTSDTINVAGASDAGTYLGGAVGMTVGFALGAIGVATGGTAVGVPLALVVAGSTAIGAMTGDKIEDTYLEHKRVN